jgi:hypothetical protein
MAHINTEEVAAANINVERIKLQLNLLRGTARFLEAKGDYEAADDVNRAVHFIDARLFDLEIELQPTCDDEAFIPSAAAQDRAAVSQF